ncbi:MAG: hypothetical protein IKS37_01360 [Solobacterium sp.]|nr:hypothetical protein [Solobacterium sp.]
MADTKFEAVFCVINAGFSDQVMFAARKAGATGGTILKGRGTTSTEAEEMFNITIQPEKEVVIILVPAESKDAVLRQIYSKAGLESEANGIAFSLPVTKAIGLTGFDEKETPEQDS